MLYDITRAFCSVADHPALAGGAMWTDGRRVLSEPDCGSLRRNWTRHRTKFGALVVSISLSMFAVRAGLVKGADPIGILLLAVVTVSLNVLASFVYDVLRRR